MLDVLAMMALVFALNLLPAFGPPTWAVLAALRLSTDIPAVPLVLFGALAAACGRFTLATGSRRLRPRLSAKRLEGLDALRDRLEGDRGKTALGLGLFALSPVPSGQLFVAAGLTGVRLVPLTAAFFAGRLVSYTIYVTAASAAQGQARHRAAGRAALSAGNRDPGAVDRGGRRARAHRLGARAGPPAPLIRAHLRVSTVPDRAGAPDGARGEARERSE